MLLHDVVATSRAVASAGGRNEKIERIAALLLRLAPAEVEIAVGMLSGIPRQGRVGLGAAAVDEAMPAGAAARPTLALHEVDAALRAIAEAHGAGAGRERVRRFRELLQRADRAEQDFLARLVLGELRQGALEGLMQEAIARAAGLPLKRVRRAVMLAVDPGAVARAALAEGAGGLARFRLQLFRPLKPMLAQTAEDLPEALDRLGRAALELKLDGARVQVHKAGGEVRVYTRRLNDVTGAVPEIVEALAPLPVREAVYDGEALALRPDGWPQPFQVTMRRFGRRQDVARLRASLPLSVFFFDCLHVDGETLLERSEGERFEAVAATVPPELVIERTVTGRTREGEAFLQRALARGHEGVMAKALEAPYEAGARGWAWLKVKATATLDLVVLAAEWGHGRRRGWLSNLHLGAYDPASGGFVMLGKTFKGMTDAMLDWQSRRLLELKVARDAHTVYVRPELVVEVAFNGLQESPHYPGGLALRFARVKRYRPDKRPEDADTIERVRAIHRAAAGPGGRG